MIYMHSIIILSKKTGRSAWAYSGGGEDEDALFWNVIEIADYSHGQARGVLIAKCSL